MAPKIVHHMGAMDNSPFPPNSLERIKACIEVGAKVIEIDATALADSDYLLVHDPTLESETDGTGEVGKTSAEAVRGLHYKAGPGEQLCPVALLNDVVTALVESGTQTRLQIDYKNELPFPTQEPLERLVSLIEPLESRVIVSTGADWQLRRLRKIAPWLDLGFDPGHYFELRKSEEDYDPRWPPFREGAYGYWDDHPLSGDRYQPIADYLAERCEALIALAPFASTFYMQFQAIYRGLNEGFNWADALHAHGIELDVWTIDTTKPNVEAIAPALRKAGVDLFTTNTPKALAPLLG